MQIDEMDMRDFDRLSIYWQSHPPVHLMVAGYLGIKPRGRKRNDDTGIIEMLKGHPGFRLH